MEIIGARGRYGKHMGKTFLTPPQDYPRGPRENRILMDEPQSPLNYVCGGVLQNQQTDFLHMKMTNLEFGGSCLKQTCTRPRGFPVIDCTL